MTTLPMSEDVARLNPGLSPRERKLARLDGDGYRSELERRCAREWMPALFKWSMYEPFKLNFPGGSYCPDFFGELLTGRLAIVETKGYNPNLRADRLKFKAAAAVHKWALFCWLEWDKHNGWQEKWLP